MEPKQHLNKFSNFTRKSGELDASNLITSYPNKSELNGVLNQFIDIPINSDLIK